MPSSLKKMPYWRSLLAVLGVVLCVLIWTFALFFRKVFLPQKAEDFLIKSFCTSVLRCIGTKVIIKNRGIYEEEKCAVVIANHSSLVDIPSIYAACSGRLRMLSKIEVFFIPFMGWAMWVSGHIGIKRGNKSSGKRAQAKIQQMLNRGFQFFLAPEGTRSPEGKLLPFKSGAFRIAENCKVPIYVLALQKPWEVLPKGKIIPRHYGEITAEFLGILSPLGPNNTPKNHDTLMKEARNLYLQHGFVDGAKAKGTL